MSDILYLKFDKNTSVYTRTVALGDIAEMECSDPAILNKLKTLRLFTFSGIRKGAHTCAARQICSVLEVTRKIHEVCPDLEIQNMGEIDFVVEYSTLYGEPSWIVFLRIALVCVITFCGAAFSIMAFNNDISVTELFAQLYERTTGQVSDGFTVLELTYSLGISLGIVTFFNHLGGRRLTKDPTPIEVEMRLYEDDMDTALIQTAGRNGRHRKARNG